MNATAHFDVEKAQLIEKIEQRNTMLERLIQNNHRVRLLNSEQLHKLEDIKNKNEKFKHKLESNEFEIAIVGLEKAGKSTFANALIKSNILPSAPERCTFTSTRLVSGSDQANVKFYTESAFEQIFQELLAEIEYPVQNQKKSTSSNSDLTGDEKKELIQLQTRYRNIANDSIIVGDKEKELSNISYRISELEERRGDLAQNQKKLSFKTLDLTDFENYFNSLEEKSPTLYKNHVGKTDEEIKDILKCRDRLTLTGEVKHFSGNDLKTDVFQAYIKGEQQGKDTSKPRSVCSIEIESTELKQLENAIIYDVPGFDSPTKIHMRQTEQRLKAADAIILVTNVGTNPSLQGTTLSVITKNTDEDGIALKDKLFVFGNQLDRVNDESHLQGNTNILISDVEKYKIGERKRVFTGSAYKYLSDEQIIPEAKLRHNIDSGIDHIREALIQYYQTERFEILKRKVDTNHKLMQGILEDITKHSQFDENFSHTSEQAKITKNAYSVTEDKLKWELQSLRDYLKKEIEEEKYFTHKFRHSLYNEAYFLDLSEEEFEKQRILNDDSVRQELAINKINQQIRIEIHKQYLEDFTRLIKSMTDDKAKEIEIRLLRTFTDAICQGNLSVSSEIESLCKNFITKVTRDVAHSSNSFTYLLERFSRDVFDILLSAPLLSEDRTNRYKVSLKEYTYLDSYYSGGAGHLINMILIQKGKSLFNLDSVSSVANIAQQVINSASNINGATTSINKLKDIVSLLQNTTSTFTVKDMVGIRNILEQAQASTTTEQVIQEINTDISHLKDILEKAVIPASNLELAFLNGVDKQIKRLIASFESKNSDFSGLWDDFISKVVPIVKKSEFDQINDRIEAHQLQKELLEQIKEVLAGTMA
ncbi:MULTISPECIES: dynamin family protein [unclassified Acinetobacter]|uniref:dynamin family protein n=1 Tax=unclassified Acinetobacter TaxID=196816 RepID=UPI00244AF44D|nr:MULTISPECIES: dynamin family protein [unclassified Acinetobacter]MDH0032501.1 dynamin family protein [Acinetobacter sp. GD04021]MDH0888092.1 dynamin family protein [Acinetobacter sp. GD03873]MDH1084376.1 dynamin family protein [Acinetobacter sp. GD03983]MDH2191393.1 dynamin family protein [Acinetobacter sp. GD03645]MDH2204946.1 dynamin family protein [Acinetobacter sp. GD03647]